jgi:chromosome partitioning protein
MELSALTQRELSFLAERAQIGRDVIMQTSLEPNKRRDPPVFTATRAADLLGRSRQTVSRTIQEMGLGTSSGADAQTRHFLTQGDLQALSRKFSGDDGPAPRPAVVLAIINQKGGVAKTTTAVHLLHYAALLGYRCLAIDADAQASLSSMLGVAPDLEIEEEDTLFPILVGDHQDLKKLIRPTPHFTNLSFVPACLALAAANELSYDRQLKNKYTQELAAKHGFKFQRDDYVFFDRLALALQPVRADYDLIVIDCPPHISAATYNVITAADMALVPASVSILDMASTFRFIEWVDTIAPMLERLTLHRIKFLATNFDSNKASQEAFNLMSTILSSTLLKTPTLRSTEVQRAGGLLRSIYESSQPMASREAWNRSCENMDAVNREILSVVEDIWAIKSGASAGVA